MAKVLLIVPAYNESASIKKTVVKIIKSGFDYVVVNDGSTDNTEEILKQNGFNHITYKKNKGIGGAVQTGYKYALKNKYDIAVQFDADGQHEISYVKKIIQPIIDNEADMVIGSRFVVKEKGNFQSSAMRRFGIKVLSSEIKLLSGQKIFDTTSGFRAINKNLLSVFAKDYPIKYPEPISTFKAIRLGFRVLEIPAKMHEREEGKSSIYSWKKLEYMIDVPLRILKIKFKKD